MIYNTRLHKASKIVKNYGIGSGAPNINQSTRDLIHTCLHTMAGCSLVRFFDLNNPVIKNES